MIQLMLKVLKTQMVKVNKQKIYNKSKYLSIFTEKSCFSFNYKSKD